jgi:hypothetical protein
MHGPSLRNLVVTALVTLLLAGGCAAHDPLRVSTTERRTEVARLRALGLQVRGDGPVLARPFAQPWTRRSWLVPASWSRKVKADETVDAIALGRDLELVRQIMARAYSGWPTAAAHGWNWDRFFADWQALLAGHRGQRLSLADAFVPVRALQAFQPDNHLQLPEVLGLGDLLIPHSALLDSIPSAPCTTMTMADGKTIALDRKDAAQAFHRAQRLFDGRLVDVAYMSYPESRGRVASVRCGDADIVAHPFWEPPLVIGKPSPERRAWRNALGNLDTTKPGAVRLTPSVDYVRLPTFMPANLQLVAKGRASWPRPTSETRALIVDLRDNGGGNAPLDALDGWLGAGRLRFDFQRRASVSCVWDAMQWNESAFWSADVHEALTPELRQEYQKELDAVYAPSVAGCPRDDRDQPGLPGFGAHRPMPPTKGQPLRVFVLVNNFCGSDCEGMVMALARLPETVIVGMNTLGVGRFFQTGQLVLPNTRLPFSFAVATGDTYGDGRSFDGYGLDVDVVLPDAASWSRDNLLALVHAYIDGP